MVVSIDKVVAILEHYGHKHQYFKVAEELSELQTLVLQQANEYGKVPVACIAEEIADVYVMLRQLEVMLMLDDRDIQPIIDGKLDRQIERMGREDYERWKEEIFEGEDV